MIEEKEKRLVFCGDIHGEFSKFIWEATERYKINKANIVVLGDFGVGFDNSIKYLYEKNLKRILGSDIDIYVIRGNHDCPEYFDGKHDYEHLKFLEDGKVYNISGQEILVIGGASSTDITWRLEENKKLESAKKKTRVWWPEERINQIPLTKLQEKVDIICSHEAPLMFEPIIVRNTELPLEQYNNILEERKYLDGVCDRVNSRNWYYGHYHHSYSGTYRDNSIYRGLGILEFFEHKIDNYGIDKED